MTSSRLCYGGVSFQSYDRSYSCFLLFTALLVAAVLAFLVSFDYLVLDTPEVFAMMICTSFIAFLMMTSKAPFYMPILIHSTLSIRSMNDFISMLKIKLHNS